MIKGPFWMNPEVLANLLLLAIFLLSGPRLSALHCKYLTAGVCC